jgi:hypothetical protein
MGPNPSYDDLQAFDFCFVNVMMQLAGGEAISPDFLTRDASTALPPGLRNTTGTVASLVARGHMPTPDDIEFVGMDNHIRDSTFDILSTDSGSIYDSCSSERVYDPTRECFMPNTPEGHVSSTGDSGETLEGISAHTVASAPPRLDQPWLGQLRECREQIQEAQRELEEEQARLDQWLVPHQGNGGHARAMAHDTHRQILEDDDGPPWFLRASQNIVAAAALFDKLLEPITPTERKSQREIRNLLDASQHMSAG